MCFSVRSAGANGVSASTVPQCPPTAMKKRLFIGNLPNNVNEKELRERFEKFGHVETVELHTKKDEQGKPFRTFAYLDMGLTQEKLVNCIKTHHDTTWKGNKIVVQVAKESYIQRIRREAERLKTNGVDEVRENNADANSWSKSPFLRKVKVEDETEPQTARTGKDAERPSYGSDVPAAGRRKAVSCSTDEFAQQKASLFDELYNGEAKQSTYHHQSRRAAASYFEPEVTATAWKGHQHDSRAFQKETEKQPLQKKAYVDAQTRHQMDNEKRLMSLKAKAMQSKFQHKLLKSAFSALDAGGQQRNKKIVFSDSEDEDKSENREAASSHAGKGNVLFDDDDEGDDADGFDKVEEEFRIKPQFEGKKGQKMWQLQSKIGTDERFRLNERFVESDEDSDEDAQEDAADEEVTDERERNLKILRDVVGGGAIEDPKPARKKAVFRDTQKLRFDPTQADSSKFEIQKQPVAVPKKKKKGEAPPPEPLPEVSSQQYYEVSTALQDALGSRSKAKEEPFSFSRMFGHGDSDEGESDASTGSDSSESAEEEKYRSQVETVKSKARTNPFEKTPFKHDSSDDEPRVEPGVPERWAEEEYDAQEKDSRFLVKVDRPRFFFVPGDSRLQEGVKFFRRHGDRDTITEKWAAMKAKVYPAMMSKRKLARRAAERKYGVKGAWKVTHRK